MEGFWSAILRAVVGSIAGAIAGAFWLRLRSQLPDSTQALWAMGGGVIFGVVFGVAFGPVVHAGLGLPLPVCHGLEASLRSQEVAQKNADDAKKAKEAAEAKEQETQDALAIAVKAKQEAATREQKTQNALSTTLKEKQEADIAKHAAETRASDAEAKAKIAELQAATNEGSYKKMLAARDLLRDEKKLVEAKLAETEKAKQAAEAKEQKAQADLATERAAHDSVKLRTAQLTKELATAQQSLKDANAQAARAENKSAKVCSAMPDGDTKTAICVTEPHQDFAPGKVFQDCSGCPEMVVVPAGSFLMGSPEDKGRESPQHTVNISKPFAVGRFSITVGEYFACVKDKGCRSPEWDEPGIYNAITGTVDDYKKLGEALKGDHYPIVGISWDDARTYAKWLSEKTGKQYRLLSEAEREYVTRAGSLTPYWWGETITSGKANYGAQHAKLPGKTVPVQTFEPNAWGLYQVHGNVWEWVEDCWKDNYQEAPTDGSAWTAGKCSSRVLRGGSWASPAKQLRAEFRLVNTKTYQSNNYGFRCARELP